MIHLHTAGSTQFTGNTLDLALAGDGFFIVADSIVTPGEDVNTYDGFTDPSYTRAGNFYMDSEGYLVDSNGKFLVGASTDWNEEYPLATDIQRLEGQMDLRPENSVGLDFALPIQGGDNLDVTLFKFRRDAQTMSVSQDGTVTFVDSAGELQVRLVN